MYNSCLDCLDCLESARNIARLEIVEARYKWVQRNPVAAARLMESMWRGHETLDAAIDARIDGEKGKPRLGDAASGQGEL